MGRKTNQARSTDKLNQATAEAARILSSDLAYLSKMMREFIGAALQAKDKFARADLFNRAMELPPIAASLGDTIGRLNGETRQTISVERAPKSTEIAPQFAPNKPARGGEKQPIPWKIPPTQAQNPGEGVRRAPPPLG